jgi:hypothetical protein
METRRVNVPFALLLAVAVVAAPAAGDQPLAQPHFLEITIPVYNGFNPASRPPIAPYEWQTLEGSPDPAEVRFIMVSASNFSDNYAQTLDYIRNNPNAPEWSPWEPYAPPDVGTSWTSPPMDFGPYVFAVQGRDAQGAAEEEFDLTRNARYVRVVNRTTGPLLEVTGDLIDPIRSVTTTHPVTEVDEEAGTAISFCLTADASQYGGVVEGYRIGWDITDPDDDDAWGMPFTPFPTPIVCSSPQIFMTGNHLFYAEAIDNDGYKSRVPILVHILPATPVEQTTWGNIKALYSN